MSNATLPALAALTAEWFPELDGRSIAVSEVDPFDGATNLPRLPMAFAALVSATGVQSAAGSNITLSDDVLLHFMFEPVKYQRDQGGDSPFFAFYDYEALRDKVLAMVKNWRSPRNTGLEFRSMDVEAEERAVLVAFRFNISEKWCPPEELSDKPLGEVLVLGRVIQAKGTIPCCDPCEEPVDPCDDARKENPHGRENWNEETADDHGPITE